MHHLAQDIRYAEQLGYRIKLLGITKRSFDKTTGALKGIELRVHPALVPSKRLIANVEGAMNAVVVQAAKAEHLTSFHPTAPSSIVSRPKENTGEPRRAHTFHNRA